MSIRHHPGEATLMRFAAGTLDTAFSLVVASHVSWCPVCARAVRGMEAMGGALLDAQNATPLSPAFVQAVLRQVSVKDTEDRLTRRRREDAGAAPVTPQAGSMGLAPDIPAPLRCHIPKHYEDIGWRRVAPGVMTHDIRLDDGGKSTLRLMKVAPGKETPEHGHGGNEITLVLKGAYCDVFGRFGPGDIADLDVEAEHKPVVEPGEACICLVASEALARFKGWVPRLLQPWFRI